MIIDSLHSILPGCGINTIQSSSKNWRSKRWCAHNARHGQINVERATKWCGWNMRLDDSFLKSDFDYLHWVIVMGAEKSLTLRMPGISGSVECFSFDEVGQKKGILLVDLSTGRIEPQPIEILWIQISYWLFAYRLLGIVFSRYYIWNIWTMQSDEIADKIIRCNLMNVDRNQYKKINPSMLAELRNHALTLRLHMNSGKRKW